MKMISGAELQVGDTIGVWWDKHTKRDTVSELREYNGTYANDPKVFPFGARIARFVSDNGMTIPNDVTIELYYRNGIAQ